MILLHQKYSRRIDFREICACTKIAKFNARQFFKFNVFIQAETLKH